ncbi:MULTISPECIES: hypothetical protein [unclassified Desulfovibrio]|uniref:hypothetical protein n=1 Tax=unclassified Desulfovibrio TaxID=2593640 RepID=UPI0018DBD65B|nr:MULTISPECIES: hypothetical protein [unclassified Desulfovibrio]
MAGDFFITALFISPGIQFFVLMGLPGSHSGLADFDFLVPDHNPEIRFFSAAAHN